MLGIGFQGDFLIVAVSDPADVVALDDIRASTGMPITPVVAARSELRKIIDRLKREETDLADIATSFSPDENDADVTAIGARATTPRSSATSTR